jgi:orotate phosphoribosyltransferase
VRERCPSCRGHVEIKTFACAVHGRCHLSPGKQVAGVRACHGCADHKPVPRDWQWVSTGRLVRDSVRLAGLLPPDVSGVAGVPRSGLIPAAAVAAQLHLPLWQLTEEGRLDRLGHGSRGRNLGFAGDPTGPMVVIDDTVYSGAAMRRARVALRGKKALFAAVYVRPEAKGAADLYASELPCPHLLEWNLFNNGPLAGRAAADAVAVYARGVASDLDGVICHDHASGGRLGTPYLLPRRVEIPLICTGRSGRDRAATEAWLRRWGCRWRRLEMLPDADDPADVAAIVRHKAAHYAASGCGLFVESDPRQAEAIYQASGRPVACPIAERVWA